jgi:SPP1 family predicted phage head-tail adaptor
MVTPYVPADRLARFRALDERAMQDQCDVVRVTPGTPIPGGDGTETTGDVTTTTAYVCRVAPSGGSPQETLIASRLTDTTPYTFALPYDADVTERDVIAYQGANYQVLGVLAPASFATSVRAVTKRIS